ncbi:hypothetical protein KEM48_008357 [Puccinia striiformis f. sp. tritici PST-130]|nr:hypothetical protein KEM48_008357 [Puccinia striiformis f. sp. tritici PST-130]
MQQTFDPTQHPHQRFNPLTHEWVICSSHRNNQPWQGQIKTNEVSELLPCDPKCFLCPNNTRAGGQVTNIMHWLTFLKFGEVFCEGIIVGTSVILIIASFLDLWFCLQNDFAAVNDLEVPQESESDLLRPALHQTEPACGKCFVICYNPRHDLTMAELSPDQISPIINAWIELYTTIKRKHPNSLSCDLEESDLLCFCTRFKNKGTMLGCSNPHPHEQVWALSYILSLAIPTTVLESQENFANS